MNSALARGVFCTLVLFSNLLRAADESMEAPKTNAEVYAHLNRYAREALQKGSRAEQLFQERLDRLLSRYNLTPDQVKFHPLSESFRIFVDARPQSSRVDASKLCFDFEAFKNPKRLRFEIEKIQKQVDQAAEFLAEIHAASWGHQVSFLFPIKEVSLCSLAQSADRSVSFEQRSLRLGVGAKLLTSAEILQAWNSGNPIRSTELAWYSAIPYLGEKIRLFSQRKDPEAILRDKIAENWIVLNPTGSLRATALYSLAETIITLKQKLGEYKAGSGSLNQVRSELSDLVQGPGFRESDRERFRALAARDQDLQGLYNLWRQKLESPQNILLVLENAVGDQMRRDQSLHLTLRRINAGVTVVNDKNISVQLEQLMSSALPVSDFDERRDTDPNVSVEFRRSHVTVSADGKIEHQETSFRTKGLDPRDLSLNADEINAGVAIDLIDNVNVRVQMPRLSPATYRRVSFYQALQEYLPSPGASLP